MTAFTDADLERLSKLVVARRLELGLGILPAAKQAGISKDTWKRVETGQAVRATTYTDIEHTLQWAVGSCRAIIEGAAGPVVVAPLGDGVVAAKIPEDELSDAITSSAIAVTDNLTAREIRELSQAIIDELKGRGLL